jgi:hypothetical protein
MSRKELKAHNLCFPQYHANKAKVSITFTNNKCNIYLISTFTLSPKYHFISSISIYEYYYSVQIKPPSLKNAIQVVKIKS